MSKYKILVIGSTNTNNRFFHQLAGKYQLKIYQTLSSSLSFNLEDFKQECHNDNEIHAILLIVSLNPRPESLIDDFKVLNRVLSPRGLHEKLFLLFNPSQSNSLNKLEKLRKSVSDFDTIFSDLNIYKLNDKEDFVKNRAWLFDEEHYDAILRKVHVPD